MPIDDPQALDEAIDAYRELCDCLSRFTKDLRSWPFGHARVYEPGEFRPDARHQIDAVTPRHRPVLIDVAAHDGLAAVNRGALVIAKTKREVSDDPVRTMRLAGLIVTGLPDLAARVNAVNRAKADFSAACRRVSSHATARTRKFAGTPLQHVYLLEACRALRMLPDDAESVSFSWSGGSHTVCRVSRLALIERLENTGGIDFRDLRRLKSSDDAELAEVKPKQPFVVANLALPEGAKQVPACLPLLSGSEPERVGVLKPYSVPARRQRQPPPGRCIDPTPVLTFCQTSYHRYRSGGGTESAV